MRSTPEYQTYKYMEHWRPEEQTILEQELTHSKNSPLLSYIYTRVKAEYKFVPHRKDGNDAFVHPLNVIWDLKKAGVRNEVTLSAALMHDWVEEEVDLFRNKNKLKLTAAGLKELDLCEQQIFSNIKQELTDFCTKNKVPIKIAQDTFKLLEMLTRNKRHFYYRSISGIFNCADKELKEKAILVKLADRTHNIQSIECFSEEKRLFECFKNLFILNNTKRFLQQKRKKEGYKTMDPLERMFTKCSKATFDAFLRILELCYKKGINEVRSMLQLAFKKFAFEKHGLWEVTEIDDKIIHPMRLYMGIVRKYDARMHQEWKQFEKYKNAEMEFCRKFFSDFKFNEEQLRAVLDYKDAYALKEVIAKLLYDPEYLIGGFSCSALCSRGMKCMKSGKKEKFNHVLLPA